MRGAGRGVHYRGPVPRAAPSLPPITLMMDWLLLVVLAALASAATLVPVRYRWGTERLLVVAFLAFVVLLGAAIAMRLADDELALVGIITTLAGGIIGSVWSIHRLVGATRVPDPLVEVGAATLAFIAGAMAGGFVLLFLLALGNPGIA